MPEEDSLTTSPVAEPDEGGTAETPEDHASEGNTNYKYRKLLYLFKFSKHHKKMHKKKVAKHNTLPSVGTPEERRNQLDQDMKNSWDTLPETLRKRKQRVSRALLSEFMDADNPDSGEAPKPPEETTCEKPEIQAEDVSTISPFPAEKPEGEKKEKELDALHRSGVYFDDEDVDDEDEDTRSSASSSSIDKNEVCIYQVHQHKSPTREKGGIEILTTAIFHKQDENDNDISVPVNLVDEPTAASNESEQLENESDNITSETQVGEEEVYQKITFNAEHEEGDSYQRLTPLMRPEDNSEEQMIETDQALVSSRELNNVYEPVQIQSADHSCPTVCGLLDTSSLKAEAVKETIISDADSGLDANKGGSSCDVSHSSLGENSCAQDDADYATIGRPSEAESDSTLAADDAGKDTVSLLGIYSSLHSKPVPVNIPLAPESPQPSPCSLECYETNPQIEKRVLTPSPAEHTDPHGLDSEAMAAVELLARAVSSDSLLLGSQSGGSVSSGSPPNSHTIVNVNRDDEDSGTDVNNPSSSSSRTSSCAGDQQASADGGDYEDVTPITSENTPAPKSEGSASTSKAVAPVLPPPNHHYEAMAPKQDPAVVKSTPLYSAVGKPKLPAPGALALPGMSSDLNVKDKEGCKPQFLLEALSKRAAAAEAASKASRSEEETYTIMDVGVKEKLGAEKGWLSKSPTKCNLNPVSRSLEAAPSCVALASTAPGCVAALSHLSAQKFPSALAAPIFYNPLVHCPPQVEDFPSQDDSSARQGGMRPCPVFKPHGFEPISSPTSDSEHLTDSFDEDETPLPSGKLGLLEEPLWRRPHDPANCTWRSSSDQLNMCRRSVTMETIVEEPPASTPAGNRGPGGPDDSRLTVREILRRFEELGGKVPSLVESCEGEPGEDGSDENENDEEKSATLREIQETLMNLEEKVRNYQCKMAADKGSVTPSPTQLPQTAAQAQPKQQHHRHHHHHGRHQRSNGRLESFHPDGRKSLDGWTGRAPPPQQPQQQAQPQQQQQHGPPLTNGHPAHPHNGPASLPGTAGPLSEHGSAHGQVHDGKHSLLQFAIHHFRQSPEKFEMLKTADGSISGSLDVIESLKSKKNKGKSKGNKENEWTWKEQVDLVKFSPRPIEQSLLRLDTADLSALAVECFVCVMRYMGDLPMTTDVTEVKCVYTVLMHCHKHEALRDEVYCQLMKQTTNNKSQQPESCQRGWRLFSIVAAYFTCSETLKPYLFKYLETAAYDKRRAYHGTAMVCLQNLRKTFKYGGRKNVPSVEEITAISAGRNSKRQMYRLPGGTERVVNTRSTTVVQDVIEEICGVINVTSAQEMEEFSLYCIVEGDTFTMPLAREEYILDVTTELHKNQQVFYLIFCRSVWHFPLRLDSHLYIEVVFNQIAPDYLEGLLLVMPGETLQQDTIYEIAKMAALLHRAADMTHVPAMKETKFLLPKPALTVRDIKPAQWVNMVQSSWVDVQGLETIQAKAQVLEMLSRWPLFGSSFFAVKRISDPKERADHILALNRHGVHFIDIVTHETLLHHPFSEVISTRKVKSEDGTLFLDMKCGNLMQQRITRLQTDQAHEISRLIRQYITLQQRVRS